MSDLCPVYAPFFSAMGCASAIIFTCIGASYGTAKSGVGISAMAILRPEEMMKCTIPVVMAGIIAIYGLVVSVLISGDLVMEMSLFQGFVQLGAGLAVGLSGLAAGFAIGIVGDAGVRGTAQQPRLFVGMILILIFAEVLGLYGLIVALIMNSKASALPALSGPTTSYGPFYNIAIHAPKPPEQPICCLRPLTPLEETDQEVLLTFEEWKARRLAEVHKDPAAGSHIPSTQAHKPGVTEDVPEPLPSPSGIDNSATAPVSVVDVDLPSDKLSPHIQIPIVDRFNYASLDCSASVHNAHKSAKSASSILSSKKDRYMLSPCAENKQFVVVELCDDIRIDTVQLANYEFFSGVFKDFSVSVAKTIQGGWVPAGTYRAKNSRGVQTFHPLSLTDFYRFIRIDFHSHYGNEYYCPLSLLRVYGLTHLEHWKWDMWEDESRQRVLEGVSVETFGDIAIPRATHIEADYGSVSAPNSSSDGTAANPSVDRPEEVPVSISDTSSADSSTRDPTSSSHVSDSAEDTEKPDIARIKFPSRKHGPASADFPRSKRTHPVAAARKQAANVHLRTPTSLRSPMRSAGHRYAFRPLTPTGPSSASLTTAALVSPRPPIQRTSSGGTGGIVQSASMGSVIGPVPKSAKRWARSAHLHEVKSTPAVPKLNGASVVLTLPKEPEVDVGPTAASQVVGVAESGLVGDVFTSNVRVPGPWTPGDRKQSLTMLLARAGLSPSDMSPSRLAAQSERDVASGGDAWVDTDVSSSDDESGDAHAAVVEGEEEDMGHH
ncbi:hypothetical protein EUX98_g4829 [Antrodiella citrinella]|uniref:V-type proton ATPase subunit C n=1 Tax=Antrodiella citrinella TaxID=2447956 RepID=A0A4S4MVT4_9APHY|nr:hypothetical protein EUX98_g4829 [Antrodiella citrinella]